MTADLFCEAMRRFIVLFHNIPFIDDDNRPDARLFRIAGNFFVLFYNALFSIQHDERDVRTLDRPSARSTLYFSVFS